MRKIRITAIASCMALLGLTTACMTKQQEAPSGVTEEALEIVVVTQLDSMAHQIATISENPYLQSFFDPDSIVLTDEQRLVRPDYLLSESELQELLTLSQKYRARAIALADQRVRQLYDLAPDAGYQAAVQRLEADINDEALSNLQGRDHDSIFSPENYLAYYDDLKEAGRLDYFYESLTALTVETLYLISNNPSIYKSRLNDEVAASLTEELQTLIRALELLVPYRPHMRYMVSKLRILKPINATTAEALEAQLRTFSAQIAVVRKSLLSEDEADAI